MDNNNAQIEKEKKMSLKEGGKFVGKENAEKLSRLTEETREEIEFGEIVDRKRVSEATEVKEGEKGAKAAAGAKAKREKTPAQIRAELIASKPSESQMKREIKAELNIEMKELKRKLRKIKDTVGYAFEVNNVIAKMRQIKEVLASLVTATYEVLKSIWLKVVHGIL